MLTLEICQTSDEILEVWQHPGDDFTTRKLITGPILIPHDI